MIYQMKHIQTFFTNPPTSLKTKNGLNVILVSNALWKWFKRRPISTSMNDLRRQFLSRIRSSVLQSLFRNPKDLPVDFFNNYVGFH